MPKEGRGSSPSTSQEDVESEASNITQERKSDPFSPPGLLSLSFSSVLVIGPFHQAILSEGLAVSCLPSAFPMVDASHLGNANPVPFFREA